MGRCPNTFQEKMVQTKRKIKSRIAITRGFGIQENRAIAAHKDILGTDIAMHQRNPRPPKILRHRLNACRAIGVRFGGVEKIRLDAQCHEHFVMSKLRGDILSVRTGAMDIADGAANRSCKFDIHMPFEQLGFPAGIFEGLKIIHRKKMCGLVFGEDTRNAAGLDAAREAKPIDLAMDTFHGRQPFGGHAQARQGLLHADPPRGQINPEHVARHPARQGHDRWNFVCTDKIHAAQSREDFGNRAHGDVAIAAIAGEVNSRHFES